MTHLISWSQSSDSRLVKLCALDWLEQKPAGTQPFMEQFGHAWDRLNNTKALQWKNCCKAITNQHTTPLFGFTLSSSLCVWIWKFKPGECWYQKRLMCSKAHKLKQTKVWASWKSFGSSCNSDSKRGFKVLCLKPRTSVLTLHILSA